jgi:hypothetical protein
VTGKDLRQVRRLGQPHPFARPEIMPNTPARIDQNSMSAGFDNKTIERGLDAVQIVARLRLRPKRFGDDSEHRAAVPPVGSRPHQTDADIAEFQWMQKVAGSALDELSSALEQVCRVFGNLLAAIIELFAALH